MELLEDEYEDELIDAFDTPEPKTLKHTKLPTTSLHESLNSGQPIRPSVQEFQMGIYPTFNDVPNVFEHPATELKKQVDDQQVKVVNKYTEETPTPIQEEYLMSEKELQRKQQQIEGEMKMYQKRFDHLAQALAGETPHQIEERKKRGEERLERQEKRHEAMETRFQHQIERLEEREDRRARIQARHYRASRSPSPSSADDPDERLAGVIQCD